MTEPRPVHFHRVETPDGPFSLLAVADETPEGAVIASGWTAGSDELRMRLPAAQRGIAILREASTSGAGGTPGAAAVEAVLRYYAGEFTAIDEVRVTQYGTPFLSEAWAALRRIPAGAPLSYTEFAAALGRPAAIRAAARACATNAPALFVPCHRVLRSDGSLGGFAWGLPVKRSLLARESGD